MASYTKQMIDLAKTWLVANPDPNSPFVKLPSALTYSVCESERDTIGTTERYLRDNPRAKNDPALMSAIGALKASVLKAFEAEAEIRSIEGEIERDANRLPEIGHNKIEGRSSVHGSTADLGRWCLAWARHGYNTFELSSDFTAAMLLTDPRELDIATVQMPFRGILFLIPDGFAKGREGGHYTRVHISEMPREHLGELMVAHAIGAQLEQLTPEERAAVLRHASETVDRIKTTDAKVLLNRVAHQRLTDKPDPKQSDATSNVLHIYATDGVRALETTIDRNNLTWDSFEQITSEVDSTDDIEAMRAVRQIVFGALAYATAIPTATTPVPNESIRAPKRPGEPTAKRWEIGRTIRIDHNLVRSVRGGAREVLYRLKHRHIVRGHYRNQAHGPAHSLRTMKWIQPHWRGPEDGAALVHTYKLDNNE